MISSYAFNIEIIIRRINLFHEISKKNILQRYTEITGRRDDFLNLIFFVVQVVQTVSFVNILLTKDPACKQISIKTTNCRWIKKKKN